MASTHKIRENMYKLLQRFDQELKAKSIKMDVLLFGGGSILHYDIVPGRITNDLDMGTNYHDFEVIEDFRIWLSEIAKDYGFEKVDFDELQNFPGRFTGWSHPKRKPHPNKRLQIPQLRLNVVDDHLSRNQQKQNPHLNEEVDHVKTLMPV